MSPLNEALKVFGQVDTLEDLENNISDNYKSGLVNQGWKKR